MGARESNKGTRVENGRRVRALEDFVAEENSSVSITQQVFEALRGQILDLSLPPGTKLSEANVATKMDVSRQPVRDAFYRLAQHGLLNVRPQRATVVSPFSAQSFRRAKFIRMGLELEAIQAISESFSASDERVLRQCIDEQQSIIDADELEAFHALDDEFHAKLFELAGVDVVWDFIVETKTHMDRVRVATLGTKREQVVADHIQIVDALRADKRQESVDAMRAHLSRIDTLLDMAFELHPSYFTSVD